MTQRLTAAALLVCVCASAAQAAKFTLEKDTEGVSVNCDGQLFTRYIIKSGTKPILWPIVGPTGKEMTRGYPMRDARGSEKSDHVHQRSLWFDHGDVNGISFWDESEGHGNIDHVEYLTLTDGDQAVIRTRNAWRAPDGKVVCEDVRTHGLWRRRCGAVDRLPRHGQGDSGTGCVRGHQRGQLRYARGILDPRG